MIRCAIGFFRYILTWWVRIFLATRTVSIMICKSDSLIKLARTAKIVEIRRGSCLSLGSSSRLATAFSRTRLWSIGKQRSIISLAMIQKATWKERCFFLDYKEASMYVVPELSTSRRERSIFVTNYTRRHPHPYATVADHGCLCFWAFVAVHLRCYLTRGCEGDSTSILKWRLGLFTLILTRRWTKKNGRFYKFS